MLRRNFLKGLFAGSCALATGRLQAKSEPEKKVYKFDELFYRPYEGNQNLVYVRNDSPLAKLIYTTEGGVDGEYTSEYNPGFYYPVRDVLIGLKDEYTDRDFDGLKAYLNNRMSAHLVPFTEGKAGKSPMRFVVNKNGYMRSEFWCEHF